MSSRTEATWSAMTRVRASRPGLKPDVEGVSGKLEESFAGSGLGGGLGGWGPHEERQEGGQRNRGPRRTEAAAQRRSMEAPRAPGARFIAVAPCRWGSGCQLAPCRAPAAFFLHAVRPRIGSWTTPRTPRG
jgi:hypothetical protein